MNKMLMYDQYDETYREVIDVKELREYILKKIEELKDKCKELIFEKQELTSALLDSTPNDKIKAKIEDILNSENSEAIEKLIEWQSLLEKEGE